VASRTVSLFRSVEDALSLLDSAFFEPIIRGLGAALGPVLQTGADTGRLVGHEIQRMRTATVGRLRSGKPPRRLR
jgi:hypothetical protein